MGARRVRFTLRQAATAPSAMTDGAPFRTPVSSQIDVERVRRAARKTASGLGFDREAVEAVAIAATELATNLTRHAQDGVIVISALASGPQRGIAIESRDRGPGIADVALALQDGFSTGGGLGSGLPAVSRLVDDLEIDSCLAGTTITARKWLPNPP